MTAPQPAIAMADIDLSDTEFWGWPLATRRAAFGTLRAAGQPPFYAEPESPFGESGPGYYALVRHADVAEASRNPEVFSSGRGATQILDVPAEFNEYFGSMINMDDPRHARLRRIVSSVPDIRTAAPPDLLLSSFYQRRQAPALHLHQLTRLPIQQLGPAAASDWRPATGVSPARAGAR